MARKKKITPETKLKLELMSYGRRISYLKRCISIVKLIEQHENETSIRCRVFEKYIKPIIGCSYVTFNNMLNEPNPEKQIIEITNKIELLKNPPIQKPIVEKVLVYDGGW